MFPQLNLTSLSNNKIVFIIAISIAIIGLIYVSVQNSCEVKHVSLINDIYTHEQYLDPDFCNSLLEQIDLFNEQCIIQIETLDCG